MNANALSKGSVLGIIAGIMVLVCIFLSWMDITVALFGLKTSGSALDVMGESDIPLGFIIAFVLIGGIVITVVNALKIVAPDIPICRYANRVTLVMGIVVLVSTLIYILVSVPGTLNSLPEEYKEYTGMIDVSAGMGAYVAIVGGIVGILCPIVDRVSPVQNAYAPQGGWGQSYGGNAGNPYGYPPANGPGMNQGYPQNAGFQNQRADGFGQPGYIDPRQGGAPYGQPADQRGGPVPDGRQESVPQSNANTPMQHPMAGVFRYPNGDYFEGDCSTGTRNGPGCYHWADGSWCRSNYVNGVRQGPTTMLTVANGWYYEGTMADDRFSGNIKVSVNGRILYEGGWDDMRPRGNGTLYSPEGRISGIWNPDGTCYGGVFAEDGSSKPTEPGRRYF